MRVEEAEILRRWIGDLNLKQGAVSLNLGSSTGTFREIDQPHINSLFLQPLQQSGVRFIHCDLKDGGGIDEVGDLFDGAYRDRLKAQHAHLLVCSNLLEHLTDPKGFASACSDLVEPGGYGIFTVPFSYPYHPDPIDTMLRPSEKQLAAMLPTSWQIIKTARISVGSYWGDLKREAIPLNRLMRHAARVALPFYRRSTWRANASRLSYLFRPYRLSLVLAKRV